MQIPGRKEELFELQKAWAVALSGRPRVVFVEGPDGVGKAQLVRAFFDKIGDQKTIEKPQLLGCGLCADSGAWSEPLRPAWEALAGLAAGLGSAGDGAAVDELEAIGRLSGFVPDEYLDTLGPVMARILRQQGADDLRSSERLLSAPKALLRDSVLGLAANHPVALFFDELEAADGQTLGFLASVLDTLLEHDEPAHFLLVLGFDPRLAASRGVLSGVKKRLRRHDHPKNRILKRLHLKGSAQNGTASDEDVDRATRQAIEEAIDALDAEDRQLLAAASLQGRRFSPATLASVCSRSELDVIRALDRLSRNHPAEDHSGATPSEETKIVRHVGRSAPFDPGGCGMYVFESRRYVRALRTRMGAEQRRLAHGRIANHLLLQRGQLRESRRQLQQSRSEDTHSAISRRFGRQATHIERAMGAVNRILVDHLIEAGRFLEAARFLTGAYEESESAGAGLTDEFIRLAKARETLWFARRAERTLLSLLGVQSTDDPERTIRAACQAALIAARCRAKMGCLQSAKSLRKTALEHARWLEDEQLEPKSMDDELGFEPFDLLTASLAEYDDANEAVRPASTRDRSVAEQVAQAREARASDQLDDAIERLDRARAQIPNRPECRPAARLIDEELSLLWEARASANTLSDQDPVDASLAALERAIEHSFKLGQLGAAVESLGRAVGLARHARKSSFWGFYAQLLEAASRAGSVEHLSRAFDLGFELLEQAQRQPVFSEAEPFRVQDALEEFVGKNTARLKELGADKVLSKWHKMLNRVIEKTEKMEPLND